MNRPEVVIEVSKPYLLESNRAYPPMEIRMKSDFTRQTTGDVNIRGIVGGTSIRNIDLPFLRIVGDESWHARFFQSYSAPNYPTSGWEQALYNLCGVHFRGAQNIRIGRLEVMGVPSIGAYIEAGNGITCQSSYFRRIQNGWNLSYIILNGLGPGSFDLRNTVQAHGWQDKAQDTGNPPWWRSKTARRSADDLAGKVESYFSGLSYVVDNFVQQGDGGSWKADGSYFTIRNTDGGPAFLNGTVPENLTSFPGEQYRHIHESKGITVENCRFVGSPAGAVQHDLLRISYPFTESPQIKNCVFVNGGQQTKVAQINWASPTFDNCEFVGWADQAAAFELSPAYGGMPAATLSLINSRFWPS